ncbi:MAG: bifunctional rhamnulose-1-phosphate aldolase/short-chain dehydrogenase [Hyphomonadaceae bacterium]|nr:bifunctional rhamnulose-1-phosphate aldolase/short-chain dehydrogenase [Hyphomonadaceae bacterium]
MDSGTLRPKATPLRAPEARWAAAAGEGLSEVELLIHRSRLLGGDLSVTNFGGGNTSAKVVAKDPLTGGDVRVLWVKGSGGDLGTIDRDGFSVLDLAKLHAVDGLYRGAEHEDAMVDYLPHCAFNLSTRAASIDTPLHALLPFAHIDHVHPDAVTAIAAAADGERLVRKVYGDRIGWLPWRRPGWELGRQLAAAAKSHPQWRGVVLQNHGLVTWGQTARECYDTTIATVRAAAEFLNIHFEGAAPFGARKVEALPHDARRSRASELIGRLRPRLGGASAKIAHFADTPEIMEFVCGENLDRLAQIGTSCPDHFLRTKIWPLILSRDATDGEMDAALADYRRRYESYYRACRRPDSPEMRDPNPVLIALPGVGLASFARDKATARVANEFFQNAINVMRGAEAVSRYQGLPDQEAFDIEYWLLEEAKLRRMPAAKPLQGKVAAITGGAGGIGRAIAQRLLGEGACVFLLDRSEAALGAATAAFASSADRVVGTLADVTDERRMVEAFKECVLAFGGVDILVANAGLASSSPIEETSLDQWRETYAVLGDGYFLAAREAFKVMKAQGGGSVVFVASKNALAATPGAAAYASAKAAELHLARCLALEGAPHNIRVNAVNPDAVLRGSQIWSGAWRSERAAAYGISMDQLEEYYRKRSLLQQAVLPEDVAEAVAFFAGPASAKSTGNILNVDGGNLVAFTR